MHQGHDDLLRRRHQLLSDALSGRLNRRQIMQRGAALGLSAAALSGLLGDARRAAAQTPTPSGSLVSWAPSGQRWELPQRAVYPLFQAKFPEIAIEWVAEPINDYIPRTVIEMSAKSDQYDILHDDYNVVPQLIALGSLEPVDARLDADPDFKADLLADVPKTSWTSTETNQPPTVAPSTVCPRIATASCSTTAPTSWNRPASTSQPIPGTRRSKSPRSWLLAAPSRPEPP